MVVGPATSATLTKLTSSWRPRPSGQAPELPNSAKNRPQPELAIPVGDRSGTARRMSSGNVVRRAALLTPALYSTGRRVRRLLIRSRAWTPSSLSRTAMSRCTVCVASRGPGAMYSPRMRLASSIARNNDRQADDDAFHAEPPSLRNWFADTVQTIAHGKRTRDWRQFLIENLVASRSLWMPNAECPL
jgi:hypothetical protein